MPRSHKPAKSVKQSISTVKSGFFFNNGYCRGKETRHGYMVYNPNDFHGETLEEYGECAYTEIILLSQLVKPGDWVIDVGANIGTHTLSFAKMVQPNGLVYSFEPQRIAFEFLSANILLNNLINVVPYRAGASNKPGEIFVPIINPNQKANSGAFSIEGYEKGDVVPLLTLDSLPISRCNLIKIVVEGMELKVLEGASKKIAKFHPFLFVENNRKENSQQLIRLLFGMNYSCWWFFTEYPHTNPRIKAKMLCLPAERITNMIGLEPVLDENDTNTEAFSRFQNNLQVSKS